MSYASVAARAVGAEVRIVAWSGRGLLQNANGSRQGTMPKIMTQVLPRWPCTTARPPPPKSAVSPKPVLLPPCTGACISAGSTTHIFRARHLCPMSCQPPEQVHMMRRAC